MIGSQWSREEWSRRRLLKRTLTSSLRMNISNKMGSLTSFLHPQTVTLSWKVTSIQEAQAPRRWITWLRLVNLQGKESMVKWQQRKRIKHLSKRPLSTFLSSDRAPRFTRTVSLFWVINLPAGPRITSRIQTPIKLLTLGALVAQWVWRLGLDLYRAIVIAEARVGHARVVIAISSFKTMIHCLRPPSNLPMWTKSVPENTPLSQLSRQIKFTTLIASITNHFFRSHSRITAIWLTLGSVRAPPDHHTRASRLSDKRLIKSWQTSWLKV